MDSDFRKLIDEAKKIAKKRKISDADMLGVR